MKNIMIVSPVASHPAFSGNSVRISQFIETLKESGISVHFVLISTRLINSRLNLDAMTEKFASNFHHLDYSAREKERLSQNIVDILKSIVPRRFFGIRDFNTLDGFFSDSMRNEYLTLVEKIKPDAVVFEYALLSILAKLTPSHIIKILDTHDKFTDRNKMIREKGGTGLWWTLTKAQETKALQRFDFTVAIQRHEEKWFKSLIPKQASSVVTIDILNPAFRQNYIESDQLSIGFVGSDNKHNEQGLAIFLENHWHKLQTTFPSLRLIIAGAKYESLQSAGYTNIDFIGKLDTLDAFYDSVSIIINPCLTGSGLKIKSVEALSYGKPLVSSAEGATGLEHATGKGLFICDLESISFFNTVHELLLDKDYRSQQSQNAIAFINDKYTVNKALLMHLCNAQVEEKIEQPNQ